MTKISLLAFGAHPDDVELSAGGTIAKHVQMGYSCGIIDLTQGELGSRGSAEIRKKEAEKASKILGLSVRENLKFLDGFFENSQENKLSIVKILRKYQPEIVLANAPTDRHPDHARAAQLLIEACYLSGLSKIKTEYDGVIQQAHRPKNLFHYIQDYYIEPSFVVDISEHINTKMESILAYDTQFYTGNEQNNEQKTPISGKDFTEFLLARARTFGRIIHADFAEGFVANKTIGVNNLMEVL